MAKPTYVYVTSKAVDLDDWGVCVDSPEGKSAEDAAHEIEEFTENLLQSVSAFYRANERQLTAALLESIKLQMENGSAVSCNSIGFMFSLSDDVQASFSWRELLAEAAQEARRDSEEGLLKEILEEALGLLN